MRGPLASAIVTGVAAIFLGCSDAQLVPPSASLPAPTGNPQSDYEMAVRLQSEGRHVESLSWFRSAVRAMPREGRLHLDYGTALHNSSIAMDASRGAVRFAVPSSQARARLRQEALIELALANELARDADERAYALYSRARVLELIGYPLDALEHVEEAKRWRRNEPLLDAMQGRLHARVNGTPPPPAAGASRLEGNSPGLRP